MHRNNVLAALWGFAEATIFFIVPDVLLSWIALRSKSRAILACLIAAAGAAVGGAAVWLAAQSNPDQVRDVFAALPAIDVGTIDAVGVSLAENGMSSLFAGGFSGVPYKLYAFQAAQSGIGLGTLVLVTVPARLARFLLVSLVAGAVGGFAARYVSLRTLRIGLMLFWIAFYAWYFAVTPG